MKIKRLIQGSCITGAIVFLTAASARAGDITYTTNSVGTEFVGGVNSLTLDSSLGDGATLTFVPNSTSTTGLPSNLDLGDFLLVCPTCTGAQTTIFPMFTFDLVVDDTTDGATGEFIGSSTGGTVSANSSTIEIGWTTAPVNSLQLGPGASNALGGNFGFTIFDKVTNITSVVAPNSGSPEGDTTVQGQVRSSSAAPEPATFGLIGAGLLSIGFIRRRRSLRQ